MSNAIVPKRPESPLDTMLWGLKWILTNDLKAQAQTKM